MDSSKDPKYLNKLVMHDIDKPVVFHGLIQNWPASEWTPELLTSVLGDKEVKIRIGLKEAKQWESTQWEADCSYETTTLTNFCSWLNQSGDKPQDRRGDNPLLQYDPEKYWCYVDYKYMAQLFEDHPDILQAIKWSDFGFETRDGKQSTIWIGSQGATTPGHYDTYGCNLVAQIYGRKKWHLFPPSQSAALYQTRIPYEESSVFSPINISKPDSTKYPQFTSTTPYIVTLDPGDVLFVPHHWWHFVETMETSISVNTWIEMETDHKDRFHEAITRMLASGILSSAGNDGKSKWLNPTEELYDSATNLMYLKKANESLLQHQQSTGSISTLCQPSARSTSAKPAHHSPDDQQESTPSHHCQMEEVIAASSSDSPPAKRKKSCDSHMTSPYSSDTQQESTPSHQVDNDENVSAASLSDSPPAKRKKSCDSHVTIDDSVLPDFITPVPCLGHAYWKQNYHLDSSSIVDEHNMNTGTSSGETTFASENNIDLKLGSKGCVHEVEAQKFNAGDANQNQRNSGEMDDNILKIFLESVTDPEVVKHIGVVFNKKMKETA
ncbi:HSPB1-associated protein 1 homolog [Amphiura filiformis]|uniref:HSPB1-associated protein 1 homolog n=1 Tax=Amphiura filiformis TaxID=82378 RepID=UPI003B20D0D8